MLITDDKIEINPPLCTGKYVPEGTWCYFKCPPDHYLSGKKYAICLNGGIVFFYYQKYILFCTLKNNFYFENVDFDRLKKCKNFFK